MKQGQQGLEMIIDGGSEEKTAKERRKKEREEIKRIPNSNLTNSRPDVMSAKSAKPLNSADIVKKNKKEEAKSGYKTGQAKVLIQTWAR